MRLPRLRHQGRVAKAGDPDQLRSESGNCSGGAGRLTDAVHRSLADGPDARSDTMPAAGAVMVWDVPGYGAEGRPGRSVVGGVAAGVSRQRSVAGRCRSPSHRQIVESLTAADRPLTGPGPFGCRPRFSASGSCGWRQSPRGRPPCCRCPGPGSSWRRCRCSRWAPRQLRAGLARAGRRGCLLRAFGVPVAVGHCAGVRPHQAAACAVGADRAGGIAGGNDAGAPVVSNDRRH